MMFAARKFASLSRDKRMARNAVHVLPSSLAVLFCSLSVFGQIPQSPLAIRISAPDTPAGAIAQIRLTLAKPLHIASGTLVLDIDPAVFGPISAVDVFSATGDQVGLYKLLDRRVEVQFSSTTGGIGRLPGMPAITVLAPVLAGARLGTAASISIALAKEPWKDLYGNQYLQTAQRTEMRVGGTLTINSVSPGGGMLPAGANVRIEGMGFAPSTVVDIDGVLIRSTMIVGSSGIDITLDASTDLTGKRVVVRNPDGAVADFYSALRGKIIPAYMPPDYVPIFPQRNYLFAGAWPLVQNPNSEPAQLSYHGTYRLNGNTLSTYLSTRLNPGEIAVGPPPSLAHYVPQPSPYSLHSSLPVRMLSLRNPGANADGSPRTPVPFLPYYEKPQLYVGYSGWEPNCTVAPSGSWTPVTACMTWLIGSPPPQPVVVTVAGNTHPVTVAMSVSTPGASQWASISPSHASTCFPSTTCQSGKFTLNLDPSSLAPGDYTAIVTATPDAPPYRSQSVELVMRVTSSIISLQNPLATLALQTNPDGSAPVPAHLVVTSEGEPAEISVAVRPSAYGEWLSVTPSQAVTPASLAVTVNPAVLPGGMTMAVNEFTVTGPANRVTKRVVLRRPDQQPPPAIYTSSRGEPVTLWVRAGTGTPVTRFLSAGPSADTLAVTTEDGGNWLTAEIGRDSSGAAGVKLILNPSGLSVGAYRGMVTVSSSAYGTYAPAKVPVSLNLWSEPPGLAVSPSDLHLSVPSGLSTLQLDGDNEFKAHTLRVSSNGIPVESAVVSTTADATPWLNTPQSSYPLPYGGVYIAADATNLPPGTYRGIVNITAPPDSPSSIDVPITLDVTPAPAREIPSGPPLGVTLVNAASQSGSTVAPGEVVSIFGLRVGPFREVTFSAEESRRVPTSLGGARVLFDGIPAPLLYASQTEVRAVVPYEIADRPSAEAVVEFESVSSTVAGLPVVPAAPGIFTADGSGQGQAKASNYDGSANSPSNPASRGSIISILATGLGQTMPPGATGEITSENLKKPVLPISATIGGIEAVPHDVRPSPGQVEGVFELQLVLPKDVPPGPAIPIVVGAGSVRSPNLVTISVK